MGILIIFAVVASVPFAGLAVWRLYARTGHQGLCGHRNGRDGRWERFSVFGFYVISFVRFSVIGAVLGAIGACRVGVTDYSSSILAGGEALARATAFRKA